MSFLSLHYIVALSVSRTVEFRHDARAHTHTHVRPLPLVFVNIKRQKDYLNMNSECLRVNEWQRRAVMFTTRTEARVTLAVILTSAASLNEDINT